MTKKLRIRDRIGIGACLGMVGAAATLVWLRFRPAKVRYIRKVR